MFMANLSSDYSIQDVKSFGARLHINTLLSIIFNSLAAYLILKHSTRSIEKYKYYILSTVFFAFLMDFHLTFIYGIFPLFPICATCPSGIARHLGPFWGVTVQFAALHFTLSFCGLSVFAGLVYQYLTIMKKTKFLQTRKGGILVGLLILLYPLPSFILHLLNVDYQSMLKHINETEPELYPFFVEANCNGQAFTNLTIIYLCVAFSQILLIHFIAIILGFKIFKSLLEMKYKMSFTTLKMRQQFFIVLAIQMAIPGLFIMVPLLLLVSMILFNVKHFEVLSQTFIQTLTLHSVANSLTIMIFIKSYRQVLQRWFMNVKMFVRRKNIEDSRQ